MRNILIVAFAMLIGFSTQAQDASKLLKQARKDFAKYNQDITDNADKLTSALEAVNSAFELPGTMEDAGAWVIKGEIYNGIANIEMKNKMLNPENNINTPDAARIALEAFEKALSLASKKSHTKDAIAGLKETEAHLSNMSITHLQEANYEGAYENYNAANTAYKLLKDNDEKSRLDDEPLMNDHKLYNAISGYYAGKGEEVFPILQEIYEKGTDEPSVFEALGNIAMKSDFEKAKEYLSAGREKFPDNTGILFAEINLYLTSGKLNELTDKLKLAIEREPDNVSVINTTGNVYEQLANTEKDAGNEDKATEYFDIAKDYYQQALSKDNSNFDANYSIGALYYNKAAAMTAMINELAQDYTPAGTKKYNEATAKMNELFEKALPFFEKAYEQNSEDTNTLIALKEIYVRQSKMDKANEIKKKLGQ